MARLLRMPRTSRSPTSRTRWTATLVAAALALAASGSAQTVPAPAPPAPGPNQDLARQHLTAARNALNDLTQLPAAGLLAGNPRRLVQQLITDFNAMLTISAGWHASYEKVDATLDALLEPAAPAAGTAGAIGTSGAAVAADAIDPAIRAKLEEFRAHLDRFEDVASGNAAPNPPAAPTPPPSAPPAPSPTAPTPSTAPPAIDDRPDTPPAPTAGAREDQEVSGVARDVLLHVEAVEVILGAQAAAQRAATAAAGGAVVTSQTASGSTRTTITGPNVTLTDQQLALIQAHLKDIRQLLERK